MSDAQTASIFINPSTSPKVSRRRDINLQRLFFRLSLRALLSKYYNLEAKST